MNKTLRTRKVLKFLRPSHVRKMRNYKLDLIFLMVKFCNKFLRYVILELIARVAGSMTSPIVV